MKHAGYVILYKVKVPSIHTTMTIIERYSSQHRMLLQRDLFTLHCGEAKACHNTLKALSKQCLAKSWLPKASSTIYEVLFITKGGATLEIPLCHSWTTLMTLYITYDCFIPLMTLGISLYIMFTKMIQFPHIPMWDKLA